MTKFKDRIGTGIVHEPNTIQRSPAFLEEAPI